MQEAARNAPVKLVTFNCGRAGLRGRLADIFSPDGSFTDVDVLFLQECGIKMPINLHDDEALAHVLGPHFRPHHKAVLGPTAGILFLTKLARPLEATLGQRWAHARAAVRTAGLESAATIDCDLFAVHGPHQDPSYWTRDFGPAALAIAQTRHAEPSLRRIIVGADWNALPDPLRDSLHGTPASCPWTAVEPALAPLLLVDVFRHLHPEGRTFTRIANAASGAIRSARRLDSIWVSAPLLRHAKRTTALPTKSDHWAVGVSLFDSEDSHPQPNSSSRKEWTLHPGTVRSDHFTTRILQACKDISTMSTTANPTSGASDWLQYTRRLRHVAQVESRAVGRQLKALAHQVSALEHQVASTDWSSQSSVRRLPRLLRALSRARELAEDSSAMRRSSRSGSSAFRPTSWLTTRARRLGGSTYLPPLDVPRSGLDPAESDPQRAVVTAFYKALYDPGPPPPNRATCTDLLLTYAGTHFRPEDMALLAAPVTLDELTAALAGTNRASAPGPSGFPYPFLELTWETTGPKLLRLALALQHGASLPVALRTTLLHKKGPKANLANYRPISVADTAVRIIGRALAKRLQSASAHALPWYQAAFMPGRRTSTLAAALQGIIDDVLTSRPGSPERIFIVFLDQHKAYDRVDRQWLWKVLAAAGTPPSFLAALRGLYSAPSTRIMVNGSLTAPVPLTSGLLQGDPLSCSLYNLALQPLLDLITSAGVGVDIPGLGRASCLAFADDVVLLISGGPEGPAQWSQVEAALAAYESASGASLNREKCGFVEVSSDDYRCPEADTLRETLLGAGFRPLPRENGEIVHLGHPIQTIRSVKGCPVAFGRRIEALGTRSREIDMPITDLITRARLSNGLLTPKLWHHTSVGGLPLDADLQIWSSTNRFLYLGDQPWLDRTTAAAPAHLGGLGLITPSHMFTAQSISFLAAHIDTDTPYGAWLRRGIAHYLHTQHGTSPAILLLHDSATRKRLANLATRADGFWGRLTHALATVPLTLDPAWEQLPPASLLTLPWACSYPPTPPPSWLSGKQVLSRADRGWLTWGDILWRSQSRAHGQSWEDTWPLGPPGAKASIIHHRPRPTRTADRMGPGLGQVFGPFWRSLPLSLRGSLRAIADLPFTTPQDAHSAVPPLQDPEASDFPWHLLRLDNRPLTELSTQGTRRLLGPASPQVPNWDPVPAVPAFVWHDAWVELNATPLPTRARADVFLWIHRRTWLSLGERGPTICPHPGCSATESQAHAIVECPGVAAVWHACLPILEALGCRTDLPFDAAQVALAWPSRRPHRRRLVLWRTAVVAAIVAARRPALARARKGDPLRLTLDPTRISNTVATTIAHGVLSVWQDLRRTHGSLAYHQQILAKKWLSGGTFGTFDLPTSEEPSFFHRPSLAPPRPECPT